MGTLICIFFGILKINFRFAEKSTMLIENLRSNFISGLPLNLMTKIDNPMKLYVSAEEKIYFHVY